MRLLTSRGQNYGQVVISIKMVVEVVILNKQSVNQGLSQQGGWASFELLVYEKYLILVCVF